MAVQRIYVEKRPEHAVEAKGLLAEFRGLLGVKGLTGLRILNRYDVEGMAPEQFRQAVPVVFSEPQLDEVYPAIPQGEFTVFATEYLPGQFDQRAASAAECVGLLFGGERPAVAPARVFLRSGSVSEAELAAIKKYVINPVEARWKNLLWRPWCSSTALPWTQTMSLSVRPISARKGATPPSPSCA